VSARRLTGEGRQDRSLLAIADPTADLPFTSLEVQEIEGSFGADHRSVLSGPEATQDEVQKTAASVSYLHLACHGAYDWQDPMNSHLVLAPDPGAVDPNPLTLAEIISDFDLDSSRLVVLSACETGVTDFRASPDEHLGLAAGFMQAGAPGVISSLWSVPDLSTALLLGAFYKLHLDEDHPLPPAAALRKAQRWLRDADAKALRLADHWDSVLEKAQSPDEAREAREQRDYWRAHPEAIPFNHPYHWAAFTLTGG